MTAKFTYEFVKQLIESEGYSLTSTEYHGSGKKIVLLCPKKHEWKTTLGNFVNQKSHCPVCSGKEVYTVERVRDILSKEGYYLVTSHYENMHQKLETVCPKGHTYRTSWDNFVRNKCRCFTCSGIKRYTVDEIGKILRKEGYELISREYKNAQQKIESICPSGHRTQFKMNAFLSQGSRCQECAINRPIPFSSIKEFVEKEGYVLVSEKYDPKKKIQLICPNGHAYDTTTFYNFKKGRRCPECRRRGSSDGERELQSWINEIFPDAKKFKLHHDPTNGKKYLELDIHIPEINLGIEYNGLIWHCDKYKDKNFHYNKTALSNRLGIRAIHIFGDEWRDRKDQIKNYLLSVMGKNSINIGARNTEIHTIDKRKAAQFLEENHIQGAATIGIAFGLYYREDLVAVMTGNKHHRQGQEGTYVLNRLAFKSGISVQGGSSKLLKALISYVQENGYNKLISWSDNRWSEGRVYEKMGFHLEENMGPDYSYIKREKRFSKQSCQKKNLLKKGAKGTMANTEQELALSLGLYRIWDCGKKRWVMDL